MFEFNPHFRKSAEKLLTSSVFDIVRDPEMEKPAPYKVDIIIDNNFDYQELKSSVFNLKDYSSLLEAELKLTKQL